jgi:signal transduction histidine kinase
MNLLSAFHGRDRGWNIALVTSTAVVLLLNFIGLIMGISIVLPHLLYIPVVIGAYRFPRQGLGIAAGIGGTYFLMVLLLTGGDPLILLEALTRVCVMIFLGWLIAVLSRRLREKEDLYRGLFDHSEAGSILIREEEGKRIVEDLNWNAAALVGKGIADLKGASLTTFLGEEDEQRLFSHLSGEGRIYNQEILFSTPGNTGKHVLISMAALPGNRTIITCVDITRRVNAEEAMQTANRKLNLLSRISSDHLHKTVDEIIEMVDQAIDKCEYPKLVAVLGKVRDKAWSLTRQLFLSETYQDLGASPPEWIRVQGALHASAASSARKDIAVHLWTERLEIYADPLFRDVLVHLVDNSIRHGATIRTIIASYHPSGEALELILEDDGVGIPEAKKESIFEYDSGHHAGLGLFICRQILEVTGIRISENGKEGKGARFIIRIPEGNWRIEGAGEDASPISPSSLGDTLAGTEKGVRELLSEEFPVADALWIDYHETKGDPRTDRIFAAFVGSNAVSLARCRRHPDGLEVDAVFTPYSHRGHGYANLTVQGLVEACGHDPLYMHSVLGLTKFYGRYGFMPIDEEELPPTIKERFAWAGGEMQGANVCPMRRNPL